MTAIFRDFNTVKLLIETFLLCIIVVQDINPAALSPRGQTLSSVGQGLYNSSDNVMILNATNFKSYIYGSKNGWFIQFYNSWCGHCRRFAPTWKALARNILTWKDIVVVAAIDCADDENNSICREYEIMHYPMLKYFPVDAKPEFLGVEIDKVKDVNRLRHDLIDRLKKEQQEGRGVTWPNIAPYRGIDLKNLWKAIPDGVKYYFFIFEKVDSYLGAEVILDMHSVNNLRIRSVTSDNEALCIMYKINKFPNLLVLGRDEFPQVLNIRKTTREGIRRAIKEFMSSRGIETEIKAIATEHPAEGMRAQVSDMIDITKHTGKKEAEEVDQAETSKDELFQLDLETALRYSLNREIAMIKTIEGEKMRALKVYLDVLAKYFPLGRSGAVFLDVIRDLVSKKETLRGDEFSQIVKSTEEEMPPVYSGPREWIGCKGSAKTLRGYPCGLWTMFHTLITNAALRNKDNQQHDPAEVLRAMHGYIKNFFGCTDCSQHFVDMAARNKIFEVRSPDESVMWLWRSHNEVNKRLAGDETEDPAHKKIQYPAKVHCPSCRNEDDTWNEAEVLVYLKKKYAYSGINYLGSSRKPDEAADDDPNVMEKRLPEEKSGGHKKMGWDFTIFDISICVVLYVTSATMLVLVCIKFAVKRTYRKKTYVHDPIGKV